MSDQYYRFFPGDYLRDTQGLTLTENGAYRMLLDSYYSQGHLVDDIQELYIICRAYQEFEKRAVDKVAAKYFSKNGNGYLFNKKAEKELKARAEYHAEQARKSKLGVEARRKTQQPTGLPTGLPKGQPGVNPPSPSPSPSPIPDKKPKRGKPLFVETSDEVRLSESLYDKIIENNPQAKKPNIQVWAKQVDLMLRVDKRTPEDVQAVIDWCQEDDFWKVNILSIQKLREKFDQLWLKMTSRRKQTRHQGIQEWLSKGDSDGP